MQTKSMPLQERPSFLHFQLSGELSHLQQFSNIHMAFDKFFRSKQADSTPLYHLELPQKITLEFYQDLILDGRPLYASNNKDLKHHSSTSQTF
jgi:hypothetical protein